MNVDVELLSPLHVGSNVWNDLSGGVECTDLVQLQTSDRRSPPLYTHVQVVLSLVLSDLLQNGQILLLDAVVLRLLPVHGFLFFHLIVVQIFDILQVFRGIFYDFMAPKTTSTPASSARNPSISERRKTLPLPSPPLPLLQTWPPRFHAVHAHTHTQTKE